MSLSQIYTLMCSFENISNKQQLDTSVNRHAGNVSSTRCEQNASNNKRNTVVMNPNATLWSPTHDVHVLLHSRPFTRASTQLRREADVHAHRTLLTLPTPKLTHTVYDSVSTWCFRNTTRYDTRCYFNMQWNADMSQLIYRTEPTTKKMEKRKNIKVINGYA